MTDFKLINITDSLLEDISPSVSLPVISGSSSNNFQTFNSQASTGTNQLQFNVQIPSLQTAVSRSFLVESTLVLKIDFDQTAYAADTTVFDYGRTNSLQAFPLNSLITTVQSNINNATVSVSTREVMASLLKMYNYRELATYNSLAPSMPDSFYQNYKDGIGSNNNVLANYSNGGLDKKFIPREAFPVELYSDEALNVPLSSLTVTVAKGAKAPQSIYLKVTTTEPLLFLSPYLSGNSNNQGAFLGLNNLTLTLNLGNATRAMSNASYVGTTKTITNVSFVRYTDPKLRLNFLTIPPVMYSKIEPKNVTNYNQYTAYQLVTGDNLAPGASKNIIFSNIQLNQIPSKILIFARKNEADLTTYDSNSFLVIKNLSINFCNKSGLLSSASQTQLYETSIKNGLQQNFFEWSGQGVSDDGTNGKSMVVPTLGSIAVIDPSLDLSIDTQYANGSSGNYNLQYDLELLNQSKTESVKPTLYLLVVNTGIFVTDNGASSFSTGLLDQSSVLETKTQNSVMDTTTYLHKIVCGSVSNLGSITKHLKSAFSRHREKEAIVDAPATESASGMSGSGMNRKTLHRFTK